MSRELIFIRIIFSIFLSCFLSIIFTKTIINKGSNRQVERNYIDAHKTKNGTISGGGKGFFLSTLIGFVFSSLFIQYDYKILSLLFVSTSFFLVGFVDDYYKKKSNSYKGLSGRLRIIIEIAILIYFVIILENSNLDLTTINIPIVNINVDIKYFYLLFLGVVLIGSGNAINLTDGLDGLASGLIMVAMAPFILLSLYKQEYLIAIYLSSLVGSLMGFLYYNFPPAKIFMGDSGSLYLGSVLGGAAIILRSEAILLVVGFIFVMEALSVIIQVVSFKTRRKRVFLMTPLHHHFEKKGIDEVRVVMGFYLVGIFLSVIGLIIEKIFWRYIMYLILGL